MTEQPKMRCHGAYDFWEIEYGGNTILHREDGPAYINRVSGYEAWYRYGELHREDGPAQITGRGDKYWWLNGQYVHCNTQEEFERLVKLKAFW
jgi:hypothetical protein